MVLSWTHLLMDADPKEKSGHYRKNWMNLLAVQVNYWRRIIPFLFFRCMREGYLPSLDSMWQAPTLKNQVLNMASSILRQRMIGIFLWVLSYGINSECNCICAWQVK